MPYDHAASEPFKEKGIMMGNLTFKKLREVNSARCKKWHPPESTPWTSADWLTALAGELGEAANIIKKIRRHETGASNVGDPPEYLLRSLLAEELADTFLYTDLLANYFNIDLEQAVINKFNKTSEKHGFTERLSDGKDKYYAILLDWPEVFVKEYSFFVSQGGTKQPWGKNWKKIKAKSIADARAKGHKMFEKKGKK